MTECIILAGGKGTRLQSVVDQVPKPMAPVGDKPFLYYLMHMLAQQGIQKFILAVGYKHEVIIEYFGHQFNNIPIEYSIEKEALGTGGAIKLACQIVEDKYVFIVNGDSFFEADLKKMAHLHSMKNAQITMALCPMKDFDRYGQVHTDSDGKVIAFMEKQYCSSGHINAGVYIVEKKLLNEMAKDTFSFETDILERAFRDGTVYASSFDNYFIDIGIPTDYFRSQTEIPERFI